MALVKCAECDWLVSNKTVQCPNCGYSPKGNCVSCRYYQNEYGFSSGRCAATEKDYVRRDKSVCPAIIKKTILDL